MGNPSVEVTEENQEAAQIEKSKAMDAISEGMRSFFIFYFIFFLIFIFNFIFFMIILFN
jgi:hypothetical protein